MIFFSQKECPSSYPSKESFNRDSVDTNSSFTIVFAGKQYP